MENALLTSSSLSGATVEITAPSIYEHSTAILKISAGCDFTISTEKQLVALRAGRITESGLFKPREKDGIFILEMEITGLFRELRIRHNSIYGAEDQYGMRYYPFISSIITDEIFILDCFIQMIAIELPDNYRLIFEAPQVFSPDNVLAELRHAYNQEKSKYIFSWEARTAAGRYVLAIPVRLSGVALTKLVAFPLLYYWALALAATALFSFGENLTPLITAVVTSWIFMLQQWGASSLPQRSTLLTFMYLVQGTIIGIWAFLWRVFHWKALWAMPFLLILTWLIKKQINVFSARGELTKAVTDFWSKIVFDKIKKQKIAAGKSDTSSEIKAKSPPIDRRE